MTGKKTCLIIGDINIDFNIKTRYYPPEGGETHAEESVFRLGGSGCNTALILQKLGLQASLAANIGTDLFADFALQHIHSAGLNSSLIGRQEDFQTGFFMILVTGAAQRTMFGNRGANASPIPLSRVKQGIDQADHIHFSGYNLLGEDQALAMKGTMRYCHKIVKPVSLDPGTHTCKAVPERILEILPMVDYFLPNSTEAGILTGKNTEEGQIEALLKTGCSAIVLKKGPEGSRFISRDQDIAAPAFSVEGKPVLDSTGAGDSFNAGFLYGIMDQKPIENCLKLGNAAGYIMITEPQGTLDLVYSTDLLERIHDLAG